MVNRRNLIGAGVLGAGGAAAAFLSPSSATAPKSAAIVRRAREFNMVTTWPKGLPGLGRAAERVAENVLAMSEGAMKIKVWAAGELVPPFESFDAVSNGSADIYHGADYYWTAKSPAYPFFTAVPFGMTAQELMGWIDFGGGQQLWDELSGQFNIKPLQGANTGHQMGGWFRREINTLDDFVGLKMRIPGQGGDVLRALGGSAISLAGGEIYQALQTGAIDATEWVGPWNDFSLGFHREAPFYYGPGFHEPGAGLCVGFNRTVWESLTPSEQAILKSACEAANHTALGEFTYQNSVHLDILQREHGTKLRSFSPEIVKRMSEAAYDVRAASGKDGIEKRIYESFEASLKKMRGWAKVSDGAYYTARELGK